MDGHAVFVQFFFFFFLSAFYFTPETGKGTEVAAKQSDRDETGETYVFFFILSLFGLGSKHKTFIN